MQQTGHDPDQRPTGTVRAPLAAGLYLIATPIGAARDITLRALDILASADLLAAEDTRTLRHLMEIHGIALDGRRIVAYHDHNGASARPGLMAAIRAGRSVAYASEAGTPLVADPGFDLVRAARDEGFAVVAAPGPSAVLTALTVAGLPTDRFLFAGFPPAAGSARRTWLTEFRNVPATLVFYESPKRIREMLADAALVFGPDRSAAVCRELTKRFEEVLRGTLGELGVTLAARDIRGEVVVVIDRDRAAAATPDDIAAALDRALETMSLRDAAAAVADAFGQPRRDVYKIALGRAERR